MGLDGVEILMAVEDAFDIVLDDAEAQKILTPGQLIDVVQAKVANVETSICLSHRAFNVLRRYLVQHRGLSRNQITRNTALSTLIPFADRWSFVRQLAADMGIRPLPAMVRPASLKACLFGLALAIGGYVGFSFGDDFENKLVILAFVAGFVGFVAAMLTKPLRRDFPRNLSNIGDLALWIRHHKADLADKSQKAWTREQIAGRVREIVIDVLACEKNYREDAHFVTELGLS